MTALPVTCRNHIFVLIASIVSFFPGLLRASFTRYSTIPSPRATKTYATLVTLEVCKGSTVKEVGEKEHLSKATLAPKETLGDFTLTAVSSGFNSVSDSPDSSPSDFNLYIRGVSGSLNSPIALETVNS